MRLFRKIKSTAEKKTAAPAAQIQYSKLEAGQLRVLKLEPSAKQKHDSVITCSLEIVSLSETKTPQYEALSYVWGDATERKPILLNGQRAHITPTLWTALKHIRRPDAQRILWIDAICINQNDVQERNEQVRLMGQIYATAARVLIWLGPPDVEIERVLSTIQVPGALDGKRYEDFPKDVARGLDRVLARPWWHRIWVIQEHVLASADPLVGCGETWIDWVRLSEALLAHAHSLMDASGTTISDGSSTWASDPYSVMRHVLLRRQWHDASYFPETRGTVAEIVERTRGYGATDKRDQVFAVANLLWDEERTRFPAPDYARSANEVFQEATVAFMRSSKNLVFLMHAIDKDDDDLGLPSWCVDFSKRLWDWGGYGNAGGQTFGRIDDDEAVSAAMSALKHDPALGTLTVLGGFVGEVIGSSPLTSQVATTASKTRVRIAGGEPVPVLSTPLGEALIVCELVQEVVRMSAMCREFWTRRDGADAAKKRLAEGKVWEMAFGGGILFNIVDAVCVRLGLERVVGKDRPYEWSVVEAFVRETHPFYVDALRKLDCLSPVLPLVDSARLKKALWQTLLMVTRVNVGKWWFGTSSGLVAMADCEVRRGDVLCSITGCRRPFLLRLRGEADGGRFTLLAMPTSGDFFEEHFREGVREATRELVTLR